MVLYKVSAKDPNQRLFRIFAWGAIILLTGILAISLYDPTELSDSARRTIGGAAVVLVLISIAGAVVFSARRGMWKLKRTFQFQLSDDGIFQMREGSPTVGMPLRQIESLREYRGWLVIRGGGQADPIAIPSEVENFEQLKQRLTSYCALTTLKTKISPLSYLPFALAIVVYVLFVYFPCCCSCRRCWLYRAPAAGMGFLLTAACVSRKKNIFARCRDLPADLSRHHPVCLRADKSDSLTTCWESFIPVGRILA